VKQLTFNKIDYLIEHIKISNKETTLIAIDGCSGVGKSWLARKVSSSTNFKWIDLDDYLIRDQGCFLDALKYADLKTEIEVEERQTLVSGLCVLEALSRLKKTPHIHIYIKRMAIWGWEDASEIEGDLLEKVANALGEPIENYLLPLEVRAYHQKCRPHVNADIVYERLEYLES
jgi:hypothetical protein